MYYDYKCICGNIFEQYNSIENRNIAKCPQCNSTSVDKLLSTPAGVGEKWTTSDERGSPIWFPKDGKPYHDRQLGKTFNNVKEKQEHMKEKGIVMDGSLSHTKKREVRRGSDYF